MKITMNNKKQPANGPHKSVKEHLVAFLQRFGVRPTRQRLDLSALLFDGNDKHITAEDLLVMAQGRKMRVSLATVYNSLNYFVKAGMLRENSLGASKTFFDTNTTAHYHFFDEETGQLWDIPAEALRVEGPDQVPEGLEVARVEVTVRLRKKGG